MNSLFHWIDVRALIHTDYHDILVEIIFFINMMTDYAQKKLSSAKEYNAIYFHTVMFAYKSLIGLYRKPVVFR